MPVSISVTQINASTRRAFTPEQIARTMAQASPILDLIYGRKKVHGGQGPEWFPQTKRGSYFQSFTAGSTWNYAVEDKFTAAQVSWVHFANPVAISRVNMLQNKDAQYRTFNHVAAQIKANVETMQYELGRDIINDGTYPSPGYAGRTRLSGLASVCTPDSAYAGITPTLGTDTNMFWQPIAYDLTSNTCPSDGTPSGFSGVATWQDLVTPTSCFYLPTITSILHTKCGKSPAVRPSHLFVDTSTFAAWGQIAMSQQRQMKPVRTASMGWASFEYEDLTIVYDPNMDDLTVGGGGTLGYMFLVPIDDVEFHALNGAEGGWNDFDDVNTATTQSDVIVGNHNISCQLQFTNRNRYGMAYNLPRRA